MSKTALETSNQSVGSRASNGTFAKGVSGNPKGRPKGSRNRSTALIEALEADVERQVENLRERSLAGDPVAMKLYWERVLPRLMDRTVEFELPELRDLYDFHDAQVDVLRQVAEGVLTPAEGQQVVEMIERAERSFLRAQDRLTESTADVSWFELLYYLKLSEPGYFDDYCDAGLFPGGEFLKKLEPKGDQTAILSRCGKYLDVHRKLVFGRLDRLPSLDPEELSAALSISDPEWFRKRVEEAELEVKRIQEEGSSGSRREKKRAA